MLTRCAIAIVFICCGGLAAAEERITLTDGRVLVGVYDEAAGTVAAKRHVNR